MVERNDAEGFLTTLASSPGIAAWQVEQATDALTLLLGSAYGQETDGGEPAERSPVITMRRSIRGGSDPLDDQRDPLPHPDAHGAEGVASLRPPQLVHRRGDQPRAAHPQGVSEGDRPAVRIDVGRVVRKAQTLAARRDLLARGAAGAHGSPCPAA